MRRHPDSPAAEAAPAAASPEAPAAPARAAPDAPAPPPAPPPALAAASAAEDGAPPANGYDPADYRWVPVRRRPRTDGWTEEKQRRFIEAAGETCPRHVSGSSGG